MHWSDNVKDIFHHLLIYRFYHLHRHSRTHVQSIKEVEMEINQYKSQKN